MFYLCGVGTRMGRPPKAPGERLDEKLPSVRIHRAELVCYRKVAKDKDLSLSDWVRKVLNRASGADKLRAENEDGPGG